MTPSIYTKNRSIIKYALDYTILTAGGLLSLGIDRTTRACRRMRCRDTCRKLVKTEHH